MQKFAQRSILIGGIYWPSEADDKLPKHQELDRQLERTTEEIVFNCDRPMLLAGDLNKKGKKWFEKLQKAPKAAKLKSNFDDFTWRPMGARKAKMSALDDMITQNMQLGSKTYHDFLPWADHKMISAEIEYTQLDIKKSGITVSKLQDVYFDLRAQKNMKEKHGDQWPWNKPDQSGVILEHIKIKHRKKLEKARKTIEARLNADAVEMGAIRILEENLYDEESLTDQQLVTRYANNRQRFSGQDKQRKRVIRQVREEKEHLEGQINDHQMFDKDLYSILGNEFKAAKDKPYVYLALYIEETKGAPILGLGDS